MVLLGFLMVKYVMASTSGGGGDGGHGGHGEGGGGAADGHGGEAAPEGGHHGEHEGYQGRRRGLRPFNHWANPQFCNKLLSNWQFLTFNCFANDARFIACAC